MKVRERTNPVDGIKEVIRERGLHTSIPVKLLRSFKVCGHLVEEFEYDGGVLVYIDTNWVSCSYERAIEKAEEGEVL